MFGQWGKRGQESTPNATNALRSTMGQFQSMGVNIATKYRPPPSPSFSHKSPSRLPVSRFRNTAQAVGGQPFDVRRGRRSPQLPGPPGDRFKNRARQIGHQPFPLSPAQKKAQEQSQMRGGNLFVQKAKQVSHQPFPLGSMFGGASSGPIATASDLFALKARQISHQPFSMVVHPPSPVRTPGSRFANKARQISHQPFGLAGKAPMAIMEAPAQARINYFKKKAKSIGFMAAQPLFKKVIEEEIQKCGRFKSFCKAITRTRRMLISGRLEVVEEEPSNEAEIEAGTYPMLKKEIVIRLFEYLPVQDLKNARLVCEFWKRFATPSLQRKSQVNLNGICEICKSEWMSSDPNIEPHEHTETISLYRFVIFLLEYSSDRRYYLPYRNVRIMNVNLYFIAGLNTEPTRVFLMFLKIFAEKVHTLYLQNVQLCPPNAFYKILDCMKRLNSIIFDGVHVWLDPLAPDDAPEVGFQMNINQYVRSITFCTNWVGEELLHWQMIFQAFPCIQELNLIDVSKSEINHCLAALINLPEDEEEEEEMRLTGGFKKLSRQIMLVPCDDDGEADSDEAFGPLSRKSFRQLTRLMINTPFNLSRINNLQKIEQTNPGRFKKFARGVAFNPFPLTGLGKRRSLTTSTLPMGGGGVPPPTFGAFKKFAKGLTRQPFHLAGKPPSILSQRKQDPQIKPIFEASMKGAARRFMIINQPFLMRKLKGGQVRVKELKPGDHSQPSFKKSARKLQLLEQFFGQMAAMEAGLEEEYFAQQQGPKKELTAQEKQLEEQKLKKESAAQIKKSALSAFAAPKPGSKSPFGISKPKDSDSKGKDSPISGKDSPSVKKGSTSPSGKDTPDAKKDSSRKSSAKDSSSDSKESSKSKDKEGSSKRESSSKMTDALKGMKDKDRPSSKTSSKGKDSPSLTDALKGMKDKDRPSSRSSSKGKDSPNLTDALKGMKDKDKDRPSSKSSSKGKDSPSLTDALKGMKDKDKDRPSSKSSSKGKDSPSLTDALKGMKDKDKDRPSSKSSSKGKDSPSLTDALKGMKEKDKDRPSSKSSSKGKDSPSLTDALKTMKDKDRPSSKSSSKGKDSPSLTDTLKTMKDKDKDKDRPSSKSSSKGKDSPSLKDAVKRESSSKGKDSPLLKDALKELKEKDKDKDKDRPSSKSSSKGKDSPSLKDAVKRESSSKGKDSPLLKDALKELKEKEKDKDRPSSKSSGKDSPSVKDKDKESVKKESSSKGKDSPSLKDAVKRESSSKGKDSPKLKDALKDLKDKERPSSKSSTKSSSKGKDSPSLKDAVKSSSKGKDSPKLTDALKELKGKDKDRSESKDRKSSGKTESSSERKSSSKREGSSKESSSGERKSSSKREGSSKSKEGSSSERKSSSKREGSSKEGSSSERRSSGKKESSSERKSSGSSRKGSAKDKDKKEDSPSQIKSPSPIKEVPEPVKEEEKKVSPSGTPRGVSPKGVLNQVAGASLAGRAFSPGQGGATQRAFSPSGGRIPQRTVSPGSQGRQPGDPPVSRMAGMLKKKAKQIMMQPFRLASGIGIKGEKKKFDAKGRFLRKARMIINQPFTLVTNPPEQEDIKFEPMGMKTHIKKIVNQPFQIPKPEDEEDEYEPAKPDPTLPPKTPLELFREKVRLLRNQPFKFESKTLPKVLAGSRLYKINIGCRRNFEDQLKLDLGLPNEESDDSDDSEDNLRARFISDMDGDSDDDDDMSSTSDESSIHETDFEHFDVNELLAEVVARFGITFLTLRVNYTRDDCITFPIVLEACQDKIQILHLTRPSKIYFSELGMQFRTCPFETPQETSMEFPCIKKLSIAHNLIDSIDEIKASFPALKNLTINVVWTEFLVRNMKPYKTYVKTNLMLSMKHGKPNESVKILTWNVQDARHPYTHKRTVVYKSNALRHMPRVFPKLSKLSVSITTAHELHVIFRECTQLHDLIVLKNSFYRIKDEDIIGADESDSEEEDENEFEFEMDMDDEFKKKANRMRTLHPTRIKNGGIKQLRFLRRLSLENNNFCLTNDSVEHGFIHLRRLRSLHISRGKRITMWALRLLRQCRFLVHVNVTKNKLKALRLPHLAEGETDEPDLSLLSPYQKLQYQKYMSPNPAAFQDPGIYITEDQMEPQHPQPPDDKVEYATTKYDKLGGKKFQYVTTSYEVNGRKYELVRRKYEYDNERDCKIWAKRVRLAEIRRQKDEEAQALAEFKKSQEVDPEAMIWRAEMKKESELRDQESDYERFINDYDSDESVEEGYCDADEDNDDDLPLEDRRMLDHGRSSESEWNDDENDDEDDDEDGNCPEADTMYEADKEHYRDTNDDRSTSFESNCDSDFSRASELRRKRRAHRGGRGKGSNSDADDSDDDYPPRKYAVQEDSTGPMDTVDTEIGNSTCAYLSTHEQSESCKENQRSRRSSNTSDKLTSSSLVHSSSNSHISAGTKTSKQCKEILSKLTKELLTTTTELGSTTSATATTATTSSSGNVPADHSIITTSSSKSSQLKAKLDGKKEKDKTNKKSKSPTKKNKEVKDKKDKDKDSPTKTKEIKDKDKDSPTKNKDKKSKSKTKGKKDKKKKRSNSAGDAEPNVKEDHITGQGQEYENENENESSYLTIKNSEDNPDNNNNNQMDSHSKQSDFDFKLQKLYRIGEKCQNAIEINQDILANERVGIEYNESMRRISMSTTSSQNRQNFYLGQRVSSTTSSDLGPPGQGLTLGFGATSSSNSSYHNHRQLGSMSHSMSSSGYGGQCPDRDQGTVLSFTSSGYDGQSQGHGQDRATAFSTTSSGYEGQCHDRGILYSTTSSGYEGQCQVQDRGILYSTTSSGYEGQCQDRGILYSTTSSGYEDQCQDRGILYSTTSSGYEDQRPDRGILYSTNSSSYDVQSQGQGQGPHRGVQYSSTSSGYDGKGHIQNRATTFSSGTTTSSGYDGQVPNRGNNAFSTTSSGYDDHDQCQGHNRAVTVLSTTSTGYSLLPQSQNQGQHQHQHKGVAYSTTSSGYEDQSQDRGSTIFSTTGSSGYSDLPTIEHGPSFTVLSSTLPVALGPININRNVNQIHNPYSPSISSNSSSGPIHPHPHQGHGHGPVHGHGASFSSGSTASSTSSQNLSQISRSRSLQRTNPRMPIEELNSNRNNYNHGTYTEVRASRRNRSQSRELQVNPIPTQLPPLKESKKKLKSVDNEKVKSKNQNEERKRRKSEKDKDKEGRKSKNKNKKSSKKERSKSREPVEAIDNERGKNCKSVGDNHVKPTTSRRRDRSSSKPRLPDFKNAKEIESRLGDLRQSLITKMVKDVKKELKK